MARVTGQLLTWKVPVVSVPGVEADDVLATVSFALALRRKRCVILTTDKDLLQMVGEWTVVRNHFKREDRDADWVLRTYGIRADQFGDYLALVGDAGDNIPGVPRIGPKRAAALLCQHATLEAVLTSAEADQGLLADSLRRHAAAARLSRQLVELKRDVSLGLSLADMRRFRVE